MTWHPTLSERQREIATGVVILALTFGGLGVGEAALRIMNLAKFGVAETVEKSDKYHIDPLSGLRAPKPGSVHGKARMSSLGFRSPEIAMPKPADVVRIVFLGSSTMFDANNGAGIEQSWPHRTWRLLDEAVDGCRLDYVNAGVPNFGMEQVALYFERNVALIDPDIAIVMATDLERDTGDLAVAAGMEVNLEEDRHWLVRHSVLFEKLWKNIEIVRLQRVAFQPEGHLQFDAAALARAFEDRLVRFIDGSKAIVDAVVLATPLMRLDANQTKDEQTEAAGPSLYYMPYMSIPGLVAGRSAYREAIVRVARRTGTDLVEAADRVLKDSAHYADSAHLTVKGGAVMAAAMTAELLARPGFRDALIRHGCAIAP